MRLPAAAHHQVCGPRGEPHSLLACKAGRKRPAVCFCMPCALCARQGLLCSRSCSSSCACMHACVHPLTAVPLLPDVAPADCEPHAAAPPPHHRAARGVPHQDPPGAGHGVCSRWAGQLHWGQSGRGDLVLPVAQRGRRRGAACRTQVRSAPAPAFSAAWCGQWGSQGALQPWEAGVTSKQPTRLHAHGERGPTIMSCCPTKPNRPAGGDLFRYVSTRRGLPEDEARWFFQQLMVAVDYCHRMVRAATSAGRACAARRAQCTVCPLRSPLPDVLCPSCARHDRSRPGSESRAAACSCMPHAGRDEPRHQA